MGKQVLEGARPRNDALVDDQRFQAMYNDPRFEKFPRKQQKVVIDPRFKGMFEAEEFQLKAPVDKRGRKVRRGKLDEGLHKFYRQDKEPIVEKEQVQLQGDEQDKVDTPGVAQEQLEAPSATEHVKKKRVKARKELPPKPHAVAEPSPLKEKKMNVQKELRHEPEPVAESSGSEQSSEGEQSDEDEGDSDVSDLPEEDQAAHRRWRLMRGLEAPSDASSDDVSSDDWNDEEQLTEEDLTTWGVGALAANPDEDIPEGEPSRRLAVVDLDWSQVRAVDILAVLSSFCAKGQGIEKVTVYLSDYGKECVAEEARRGPALFWKHAGGAAQATPNPTDVDSEASDVSDPESDHDSGSSMDESSQEEAGEGPEMRTRRGDAGAGPSGKRPARKGRADGSDAEGDEFDSRQLQLYERSKLRYYYAVVGFSSVEAAVHVENECNGLELLRSANKLDLRFISDEDSFEGREIRDEASSIPPGYEPPNFQTAALQQTNVKLTWDATDTSRKTAFQRVARLTGDQIAQEDFKAYLGSESEEEQEEAARGLDLYRALLQDGEKSGADRWGGKSWGGASSSDEDEGQAEGGGAQRDAGMEVVFKSGLEGLAQRLAAAHTPARKGDAKLAKDYVRRKRDEETAARLAGRRHADSDSDDADGANSDASADRAAAEDDFFQHETDPFADPFFQDGAAAGGKGWGAAPGAAGKAGKEARRAHAEEKRRAAHEAQRKADELNLLLLDDSSLHELAASGGQLAERGPLVAGAELQKKKRASLKDRARAKKLSKLAEREAGSDEEELGLGVNFKADLQDPRFTALMTAPEFALDPTDPRYRKASGIVEQLSTRRKMERTAATDRAPSGNGVATPTPGDGVRESEAARLQSMVAHLKRRGQQTNGKRQVRQSGDGYEAMPSVPAAANAYGGRPVNGVAAAKKDKGGTVSGSVAEHKKKRKEAGGFLPEQTKKRKGHAVQAAPGEDLALGEKQIRKQGLEGAGPAGSKKQRLEKKGKKRSVKQLDAES